jgi:hypothetical protein
VLCINLDAAIPERLQDDDAQAQGQIVATASSLSEGATLHGREPFDVVLVELDAEALAVRQLRAWHPVPAIVTIGRLDLPERAIGVAIASGAHDHVLPTADRAELERVITRSWRRNRADRTRRAAGPPAPDLRDLRQRTAQFVSLASAARDLLDIDEEPHATVRSLLDQALALGQDTVQLTTRHPDTEVRERLKLDTIAFSAWGSDAPRGTSFTVDVDDDVELHGSPGMIRTALVVLYAHALRGASRAQHILVDTEVRPDSVRLRVHDDGPAIGTSRRRALYVGDVAEPNPVLMTVEHVAARHGGTAWLADSDRLATGLMAVVELPRRTSRR